jgi:hypothetical protein
MRITREIDLNGRRVTVKELTVAEIRAWLVEAEAGVQAGFDLVGQVLFEQLNFADIARMSDLNISEMDALTPSEVRAVAEACESVNADFFLMRARLATAGARLLASSSVPSVS